MAAMWGYCARPGSMLDCSAVPVRASRLPRLLCLRVHVDVLWMRHGGALTPTHRCDGEGRVVGGMGALPGFGWWPIKAYKPCSALYEAGLEYERYATHRAVQQLTS